MSLATGVVNDEGIGHTAGTPVAGNVALYWGVSWDVIDRQISGHRISSLFEATSSN
jgi:hypothetical protein